MTKRIQARRGNGRYTRNTTENTFGLHVCVCPNPECRRFNPHRVGTPRPAVCHACGGPLHEERSPAPSAAPISTEESRGG